MDIKEIKNKSVIELKELLAELGKKLAEMNFKVSQNQMKNIREVRVAKKDIAKIMTIMSQNKKVK